MTAREEFLRGLEEAGGWADGDWEIPEPALEPEPSACNHPTCACTHQETPS
ncbi:MAG: hypothetical protein HOY79_01050 [Streptomyces sp.]|nr:hypothetical protein [Streptomyces sp.]